MEFRNWNIFSFLEIYTDSPEVYTDSPEILCSISTYIDPNNIYDLLLVFLVFSICYWLWIFIFAPFWKTKVYQKRKGRVKKRKKEAKWKDWNEEEERKRVISVLKSSLSHQNTISFRKLLCPDLSCKMCKKTASEVQQLLDPDIKVDVSSSRKPATRTESYLHPCPSLSAASPGLSEYELSLIAKRLHEHSQKNYTIFFWGLPSLHSESLPVVFNNSRDSCQVFIFNLMQDDSTYNKYPVHHPHHQPVSLSTQLPERLFPSKSHNSSEFDKAPVKVPCDLSCQLLHNEPESLASSDIHHLEQHLLQKKQEHVWGFPAIVKISEQKFNPPIHRASAHRKTSLVKPSVYTVPATSPLNSDLTKKLEHHLHKRLIQHRWGLPRRILECLKLRKSPEKFLGISEISDKASKIPFDLEHDSDRNIKRKDLTMSRGIEKSQSPTNLQHALKTHLSKKSKEIVESQLPGTVKISQHASKMTVQESQKSHSPESRKSSLAEGETRNLNTVKALPFIDYRVHQMMESHIVRFDFQMKSGLPQRVYESTERYNSMLTPSLCSTPLITKLHPERGVKSGDFNPPRKNAKDLQGNQTGLKNISSSVDRPVPDPSPLQKGRRGTPRLSPVVLRNIINEEIQTFKKTQHHMMLVKTVQ